MSERTVDILVVGLGPAGSRAAVVAAGAGCSVVAVDRKERAGHPVQCAEFVPSLLGQELDDLEPVTRQRIRAMVTFIENEQPDLKDDFSGRIIDRAAFDETLVDQALEAGADCRFGTPVDVIGEDGRVRLAGGGEVSPLLIVGADGPRSRAGKSIGRINRDLVETRQVTVPLTAAHDATDIYLSADIPGGYGWLFPKGDVANLGVGVAPAFKARLKPLLDALHASLVDEGRVGPEVLGFTGGAIPVGGMLDPVGELGTVPVLLAGDAAGLTNPVTGAGIASAVISGGLAGQASADWLAGNKAALADYADELDDLFSVALARAVDRRKEILVDHETESPTHAALKRGWIAYPEYWAA